MSATNSLQLFKLPLTLPGWGVYELKKKALSLEKGYSKNRYVS